MRRRPKPHERELEARRAVLNKKKGVGGGADIAQELGMSKSKVQRLIKNKGAA